MSVEDIEKTAHGYLVESRVVGEQHQKLMKVSVVESYLAPVDFSVSGQFGDQEIKKGSWILGVKVADSTDWEKILGGEFTGFSVGGFGVRDAL
jgi:hypothetical protein